jgi:DNA-binding MarR family transcriptional regulator
MAATASSPNPDQRAQARIILHAIQLLRSRIVQQYTQAARHEAAVTDITFPQWSLMLVLRDLGQATIKELAEHLHVSSPSVSTMVERLVEMGMLQRTQQQQDRRAVEVRITESGEHAMAAVEEEMIKTIEEFMHRMGPRLTRNWCEVYARIREIIEEEEAQQRKIHGNT